MIHATKRAIAMVARKATSEAGVRDVPAGARACDGARTRFSTSAEHPRFGAMAAEELLSGAPIVGGATPTCPHCLVLLDEAMLNPKTPNGEPTR